MFCLKLANGRAAKLAPIATASPRGVFCFVVRTAATHVAVAAKKDANAHALSLPRNAATEEEEVVRDGTKSYALSPPRTVVASAPDMTEQEKLIAEMYPAVLSKYTQEWFSRSTRTPVRRSDGRFITFKPITPGIRHRRDIDMDSLDVHQGDPVPDLCFKVSSTGGRDRTGQITIRGRGGGDPHPVRRIDFARTAPGKHRVLRIEFDPKRSAFIALLLHVESEQLSYILAPQGLKPGDTVESYRSGITQEDLYPPPGKKSVAEKIGNCLALMHIPLGTEVHCIALHKNGPGILCRSAGTSAMLQALNLVDDKTSPNIIVTRRKHKDDQSEDQPEPENVETSDKEDDEQKEQAEEEEAADVMVSKPKVLMAHVKLQSGEVRLIDARCMATVGKVSNPDWMHRVLGKAGANRHRGRRPKVRGVAMNAKDHPHGGGEGKTKGEHPVTYWGQPTKGYRTRYKFKPKDYLVTDRRLQRAADRNNDAEPKEKISQSVSALGTGAPAAYGKNTKITAPSSALKGRKARLLTGGKAKSKSK